ncbi:MAG: DUF2628 domain-containing protein [Nitrospira sp.]|nr:DUF2628 domain-containing protein [Nitrospira sp.]
MKFCNRCSRRSPDEANFCPQCGAPLDESGVPDAVSGDQSAAASAQQDEETLWRLFIGPNADHYLETFKKFASSGGPRFALSWNWPAFLYISFLWFLYRKMYLHAFVYAVGPMVSAYLTGDMSAGLVWGIMAGVTGNYLYYWHCREHIERINKIGGLSPADRETALKEAGGVQPYVIWVGVALYVLFFISLAKMAQEGPPDRDGRPLKQVEFTRGKVSRASRVMGGLFPRAEPSLTAREKAQNSGILIEG